MFRSIIKFPNKPYHSKSFKSNIQHKRFFSTEAVNQHDYDVVIIGGGSGGIACAQEIGKIWQRQNVQNKIALIDFVDPSPQNSSWGLGGTCVNVGCIPKKLMHQASILGENMKDARYFGWENTEKSVFNWTTLTSAIQDHIKSLNWGYRTSLLDKGVEYINAKASFIDSNTVQCITKKNKKSVIRSKNFVLAVGGRPKYLDIPGAKELAITSDDLFSLKNPPGKTLVVGASYVALECAGFLTGLGFDTTVMSRSSVFLRHFDQQMAGYIVDYMKTQGTKIQSGIPIRMEKIGEKIKVYWAPSSNSEEIFDTFDTVLLAIGRIPNTSSLNLNVAGVSLDPEGKILALNERTNIPHIYALGDILSGKPELTPVAIRAGRLLAQRLYGGSNELMNYDMIPTTVFTPVEYGSIGISEEAAKAKFGEENTEVFHSYYQPLEWTLPHKPENLCYSKVVCNRLDSDRIVGAHILGPNAGEIAQGLAIAMNCGLTKKQLDNTIGIHPTVAEELVKLDITKRSGMDPKKTGC